MAKLKTKTAYLCSACGDDFPKWNGQCPTCKEWGTLSEFKVSPKKNGRIHELRETKNLIDVLSVEPKDRIPTGLSEADRVLGGGLLSGSLILLGGSPGVGKSTLALHICSGINRKALYISAEESEEQVALRARRLHVNPDQLFLSGENELDGIIAHIDRLKPELVVVDSIQTVMNSGLDSLPGSPSQIRDCGQRLLEVSKQKKSRPHRRERRDTLFTSSACCVQEMSSSRSSVARFSACRVADPSGTWATRSRSKIL